MQEASDANGRLHATTSANGVWTAGVSPSLLPAAGKATAYELKFLVAEVVAEQVEHWARQHLTLDPHADASLNDAYRIHSLYLDTPALDVYHRRPTFGRRKFRLRRYGDERVLFLERKTKSGERVSKRRTRIAEADLERLQLPDGEPTWTGHWFHRRLLARRLQPTCRITYDRVAHVGTDDNGPLRLTLDRHIHGAAARDWQVAHVAQAAQVAGPRPGLELLTGQVVLELKYRNALPLLFKRLVHELNLNPQPASKYRLCIEASALHTIGKEVG